MARSSDVVIGIDVGRDAVRASALAPGGAELGVVDQPLQIASAPGPAALDPIVVWTTVVDAVHRLAHRIPSLGGRTVALGLTGSCGGLCLLDEDGEPVGPLMLADEDWEECPDAETGRLLDRLLAEGAPELDRAAHAVDLRGWVIACLTGQTVHAPPMTRDLERTGSRLQREQFLPRLMMPSETVPLHAAGAAACGLWEGTPLVAVPPAPLAAGVAAGLAESNLGLAFIETDSWLVRPRDRDTSGEDTQLVARRGAIGGRAIDWLVALAQNLLAEAGLIGLTSDDLRALLERQAGGAHSTSLVFETGVSGSWAVHGLCAASGTGDLARAIHEAIARSCRAGFEAGGLVPDEVRLAGRAARNAGVRAAIARAFEVPTQFVRRPAPAATGAALCALQTISEADDVAGADWVEPFLEPLACD